MVATNNTVSSIDLKALNVFIHTPVSQDMIHKLVVTTLQVIPCQEDKTLKSGKALPSLMTFINRLVRHTNVYTGTLMATLVYLDRLKLKLPRNALGLPCTRHRIFLSCLILASKYHNDLLPKNKHWAKYSEGLFSLQDVNLMERQLLYLLNWDVHVSNADMVGQLGRFLAPIRDDLVQLARMRAYLRQQQAAHAANGAALPGISRLLSTASALSLGHMRSDLAHSVSLAGLVLPQHARQASCSLVESLSPLPNKWMSGAVDPGIEMAARTEEAELAKMLNSLCRPLAW